MRDCRLAVFGLACAVALGASAAQAGVPRLSSVLARLSRSPRPAASWDAAVMRGRLQERLSLYVAAPRTEQAALTPLGRATLERQFSRLVFSMDAGQGGDRLRGGDLDRRFGRHAEDYVRVATFSRLPNALLFGSDVLGPDLGAAFAALVDGRSMRDALENENRRNLARHASRGRSVDFEEIAAARAAGLPLELVLNLWPVEIAPPGLYSNMMAMFYRRERVGPELTYQLFPVPEPDALKAVLVAAPGRLALR